MLFNNSTIKRTIVTLKKKDDEFQTTISHCRLFNCGVSEKGCKFLASVLSTKHSVLKELDLSENNLKDTDTKLLNILLEDPGSKLDQLK